MLTQNELLLLSSGKAPAELQAKAADLIERLHQDYTLSQRRISRLHTYIDSLEYDLGCWK